MEPNIWCFNRVIKMSHNPLLVQFYLYKILQLWCWYNFICIRELQLWIQQELKMTSTFNDAWVYSFLHVWCDMAKNSLGNVSHACLNIFFFTSMCEGYFYIHCLLKKSLKIRLGPTAGLNVVVKTKTPILAPVRNQIPVVQAHIV